MWAVLDGGRRHFALREGGQGSAPVQARGSHGMRMALRTRLEPGRPSPPSQAPRARPWTGTLARAARSAGHRAAFAARISTHARDRCRASLAGHVVHSAWRDDGSQQWAQMRRGQCRRRLFVVRSQRPPSRKRSGAHAARVCRGGAGWRKRGRRRSECKCDNKTSHLPHLIVARVYS